VKGTMIMSLKVDILAQDNDKKIIKKEKGFIDCEGYYSSLAYSQLKYNLIYAQNDEVFNNETIHIYARKYGRSLFKFILCENIDDLKDFDYSNSKLKSFAENRVLEHLKLDSLDLTTGITVIVVNDTKKNVELVKRFCFLNSFEDKKNYQVCFRFDNNQSLIRQYKKLRDFGQLYREFNTAIKFDLAVDSIGKKDRD